MRAVARALALTLLAGPSALAADAAAVPPDVLAAVRARLPGAKVLSASEPCALGPRGARSYGILVQAPEAANDGDPLRPVIALAEGSGWKVVELRRRLEGKHAAGDFLGVYWRPTTGYTGGVRIRCASPKDDPDDIGVGANGEFLGTFASKLPREVRHLCFTADDVYNSWACWTVNPGTGAVEPSFLQLNAD